MARGSLRVEQGEPEQERRAERPIDLVHLAKQCLGDEHLEYEVLRLYDEGGILANGQRVGAYFETKLATLADHPLVGEVRARGLLAGVELVADKASREKFPRSVKLAEHLFARGYANGVIFRAFADDIIGLAPPLCCSDEDIDVLIERFTKTLDDVLAIPDVRAALV